MLLKRLDNNSHVYHVMLLYLDISVEEPEEFMRSIRAIAEDLHRGMIVQVINTSNIAGVEHLLEILTQSLEAERRSCLIAKRVEVDILLRLACTRQITDAMEKVGLRRGSNHAILVSVIRDDGSREVGGESSTISREVEREDDTTYYNLFNSLKDRLKGIKGVITVHESGHDMGGGAESIYGHLAGLHGLSEQELNSCIGNNRLVGILAERANLLHR